MKLSGKNIKKRSLNLALIALIFVISITNVFAGIEHYTNKVELNEVINGAIYTVTDDKYPFMVLNPVTWQNEFIIKDVSNGSVILKLNRADKTIYPAFTVTATVNITYVNQALATSTINGIQLSLNYDPLTGNASLDQNSYHFKDAHLITVSVVSISTSLPNNEIPRSLVFQSDIDVERYYNFDVNIIPVINHSVIDVDLGVDRTLGLNWPVIIGVEEYDLEWTFIDDYNSLGANKLFSFNNNATRVAVTNNHYELPLVYEKGYILYRVRGVGRLEPDFIQRVEGRWSSEAFTYTQVSNYPNKYSVAAHESDNFNWGYQAFFTENGVKGEGVSYFDGTLKNRQNISKLNTEDKVVIQETFYDFQGRAAISVLPTPINERVFKYRSNFNLNQNSLPYTSADFDEDGAQSKMANSNGASNYYSPQNINKDGSNSYIPDANEFPFNQTVYTNDLTGRIKKQGGLGIEHKIGSGHESLSYYGKPLQNKLTKLFGTDVGFSSSYNETMVIDPNGQASVSVTDKSGRVIATSLAGNPPNSLEALASHSVKEQIIAASIIDNNIDEEDEYGSITSIQSYISKAGGIHDFDYSFTSETYSDCLPTGLCFDCIYDLTISVFSNETCLEMIPGGMFTQTIGQLPLDITCTNVPFVLASGVISMNLPVGSYTITKKLSINKDAVDFYADQYMENSNCLLSYQDFLDTHVSSIDFSNCELDYCNLQCYTMLGSYDEWTLITGGTTTDYQDAIDQCVLECNTPKSACEQYTNAMVADMSKGGQYGLFFNTSTYLINVVSFPLSIFNVNNSLPENWDYTVAGTGANWTTPQPTYKESDGITLSEIDVID
ncbi:MAG: hypothetical protein HRT73_09290, partial [Flavobacteriales bacterium]|nr:hypothetical protein [Flavobacteriales bacterium]